MPSCCISISPGLCSQLPHQLCIRYNTSMAFLWYQPPLFNAPVEDNSVQSLQAYLLWCYRATCDTLTLIPNYHLLHLAFLCRPFSGGGSTPDMLKLRKLLIHLLLDSRSLTLKIHPTFCFAHLKTVLSSYFICCYLNHNKISDFLIFGNDVSTHCSQIGYLNYTSLVPLSPSWLCS